MATKIEMTVTEEDIKNADYLKKALHKSSRAETVRTALKFAADLSTMIQDKDEVMIRRSDGSIRKLIIPGITGTNGA